MILTFYKRVSFPGMTCGRFFWAFWWHEVNLFTAEFPPWKVGRSLMFGFSWSSMEAPIWGLAINENRDTAEKKTEKNLKKTESICENRCFSRVWKIHFEGIEMFSWNISLNIRKQTIYRLRHFERGIIFPKKTSGASCVRYQCAGSHDDRGTGHRTHQQISGCLDRGLIPKKGLEDWPKMWPRFFHGSRC